jgi:hypothetical protein
MEPLVALSIRQPWIDMIVRGVKTMEIRNWMVKRRGLIVLHAPRRIDFGAAYFYGYKQPWTLPRGKLIALAEITDVVELDNESWVGLVRRHRQPLPMVDGAYGVLLDNVKLLERPVDCRGKQMFFPITGNILERVLRYAPK